MPYSLRYVFILLICTLAQGVFGQTPSYPNYPGQQQQPRPNLRDTGSTSTKTMTADQQLDSLRKHQDKKKDTVIFNSKFVRVTGERFLRDSTQLFPLDTSLNNYENYSPLYQPRHPTINLGNLGTDERSLLFEPSHTIGFDVGLHTLDVYMLNPWDINYYRARVPYTQLYLVTGGVTEQIFKVTHAQNISPQLNIGFNLNYIGSRGYYSSSLLGQNVSDVNAAAFAWYESKNKRYNLLANLIYNNLKAPETGSILGQDTIYVEKNPLSKTDEPVRLPNTYENWKSGGFYLKQFYYIGHLDSLKKGSGGTNILPTQRVSYTLNYNSRKYDFKQNDVDNYGVFSDYYYSSGRSRDSLTVQHLQNDFTYSFYLRSKAVRLKNEVKLDLGLTQDYYHYSQYVNDTTLNQYGNKVNQQTKVQNNSFQDITLKARFSYRLSDRLGLEGNFQQIAQGRDFGDFLYDGKLTLAGGEKTGRIIFEGYTQSSSPPLVYTDWISNHFIFHNKFSNQKTSSVSFTYINDDLKLDLKAEYFLITDYLYFAAQPGGIDATPTQLGAPINLLKVSFGKSLSWRRWHFDNFLVYQKSDYQNTLRIPRNFIITPAYIIKPLLFNVLYSNMSVLTYVIIPLTWHRLMLQA